MFYKLGFKALSITSFIVGLYTGEGNLSNSGRAGVKENLPLPPPVIVIKDY